MTNRLVASWWSRIACVFALAACGGSRQQQTAMTPQQAAAAAMAQAARPRLVLSIVIDQLGSQALRKLEPLLDPNGALAEIRKSGIVYERVVYPYAATLTAPGHAAIYSGAVPSESAVTGNYLVDRTTGLRRAFVDDGQHAVIGVPDEFAAPVAMRAATVGDTLKAATSGRGKVVSLSLKDRSAILPAGRSPDLVLWYEAKVKGFTTSSFYAKELPAWLVQYQAAHPIDAESVVWEAEAKERLEQLLGPDAGKGEGALEGFTTSFPHALARSPRPYDIWPYLPAAADALLALALESAVQMQLGADDDPDLLAVSISSTDYTGHTYGPDSWEYADHLMKVDRALGTLIHELARRTTLAVLITSDHGSAPLPERVRDEHPEATRLDPKLVAKHLDAAVDAVFGKDDWIAGYVDTYVVLTPRARSHEGAGRIRATVLGALRAEPGVAAAFDCSDLVALARSPDPLAQAVLRSIHPETSGDFYVVTSEYVMPDIGIAKDGGTTHGSPYTYDTDVPVWVLAPGIVPAHHTEPFDQRRVASTLAALLAVPAPLLNAPPALPGVGSPPAPR